MIDLIITVKTPDAPIEKFLTQLRKNAKIPLNIIMIDLTGDTKTPDRLKAFPMGIKLLKADNFAFDLNKYLKNNHFIFLDVKDSIPPFFFMRLFNSLESCLDCEYSYTISNNNIKALFRASPYAQLGRNPAVRFRQLAYKNIFGVYCNLKKKN